MHGPDIQWYVVLSALLFATGALGVMLRRSPLIILLSVEIMLNSANLLLIAFSRLHGREDGQIFAISVMAVAASEVVVGLGLIVAMGRRNVELDVDKLRTLRRMNAAAWVCLLLPLASAVAITLGGTRSRAASPATSRRSRRWARSSRRSSRSSTMWGEDRRTARTCDDVVDVALGRAVPLRPHAAHRPAGIVMMLIVAGVGALIVAYSVGYMDGEDEERRYFAYMSLFVFSMLLLVAGRQPAAAARRLGHGRALELPADRLLPGSPVGDRRRQEGVRDERVRRRDDGARALPADPAHRAGSTTRACSPRRRTAARSRT